MLRADGAWLKIGEEPFFWLGDTAWLMLQKLTLPETYIYLRNRAERGFTVIQTVACMRHPGINAYGHAALTDEALARPDENSGYWRHVDAVLDMGEELGLYFALLPTWGSMVINDDLGADAAEAYGRFLAKRYGQRKNIIWVNGGDISGHRGREFWLRMGGVLKEETPDKLVSFHPFGRTLASDYFKDEKWLDIDMFQSGHRRGDQLPDGCRPDDDTDEFYWYGEDLWKYVNRSREGRPLRPVLDGEPSYENIPQGLHDPNEPLWRAWDVRRYAYRSLLAGACGFTYGHNAIMQFHNGEGIGAYGCTERWQDAMQHPGANDMAHVKDVFTSLPWQSGRPAQELLLENGKGYERISASKGDGYALFYSSVGGNFKIATNALDGDFDAFWINPSSGARGYIGPFESACAHCFTPPNGPYDNRDWLLLFIRN